MYYNREKTWDILSNLEHHFSMFKLDSRSAKWLIKTRSSCPFITHSAVNTRHFHNFLCLEIIWHTSKILTVPLCKRLFFLGSWSWDFQGCFVPICLDILWMRCSNPMGSCWDHLRKDIFDYIISELGSLERMDDQIRKLMAQMLMRNLANVEKATGSLVDSLGQGSATVVSLSDESFKSLVASGKRQIFSM